MDEMDPTISGERYWQYNKTSQECHGYMFEHSVATDVTFRIEQPDARSEKGGKSCSTVRAHKYVLMSRSPVFSAMVRWSKEFDQGDEIVLDDTDPEAFNHVIRFMYTDKIELQPHLVMHIWYLAKKYFLSTLEATCVDYLENQLSPTNAAVIYDQSLFFDEERLSKRCFKILTLRTDECLKAPSFVDIHKTTLGNIIDLESTNCNEMEIYKACCNWATQHCADNGIIATSENIRQTLGDIINKIRFPAMDLGDFTSEVIPSGLLVATEIAAVLAHIEMNAVTDNTLPFLLEDRCYKGGRIILLNDPDTEMTAISGPVSSYDLDLDIDGSISLHEMLLYDSSVPYNNRIPQGTDCLQVKISLNGAEIYSDHLNKQDMDNCTHVKKFPLYGIKIKSGHHKLSIKHIWKGKCFHCGNFAQCGSTLGAQFCYNCGNYSGLRPTAIHVCNKSKVILENSFVTIRLENSTENKIPVAGFIFSDPKPI